ncbi:MAG TPA: DUF4476 domain-containing protein [Flavobacteriales bacterium]|jgi:hypothetical protein|nr:DUF4476 domain-containing protein [Flavobacteriales bacterium]
MLRTLTLSLIGTLIVASTHAQTSDLVFFTDDGAKFTLIVDGDVKNDKPATRVVATGIRTESPMVMVTFEDPAIPQLRKPGYFPLGKEYTIMVTTNKKGERVMRPTGEAALGTAASTGSAKPKPTTFEEDVQVTMSEPVQEDEVGMDVDGVQQTTTITVVEDEVGGGTGENVNINMGINGIGFNMNVKVDEGSMGTTTSGTTTTTTRTTTTRTTTTSTPPPAPVAPAKPVKEPEVYSMPGYTGPVGCAWPMSSTEFSDAKQSIESKSFEESKMTTAKQVGRDRCFTVEQVKGIMATFSFEDSKLDFAKYAYDRTYDIGNYFKVNDAFTFESSMDELNEFIQAR